MIKILPGILSILKKVLNQSLQISTNRRIIIPRKFNYSTGGEKKIEDAQQKIKETKVRDKNTNSRIVKRLKQALVFLGASVTYLGMYLISVFGEPERDIDGTPIPDDLLDKPIVRQYVLRAFREFVYYAYLFTGPLSEKLLPDHLAYPYMQPKYTLVLELTDVLVHAEWSPREGWRFKKRPLFDHFLETLKDSYEIVIYTAEHGRIVFPLMDAMDPNNIIAFKLVRGTTHFTGIYHVKRLNNLNRDLRKVICVDWNYRSVKDNPENLFNIKRWDGNDDDTSLLDLATFLKTIAENDIEDVRDVLKHYSKYTDPIAAFREKQERFIEELENQAAAQRGDRDGPLNTSRLFFPRNK